VAESEGHPRRLRDGQQIKPGLTADGFVTACEVKAEWTFASHDDEHELRIGR